MAKKASKPEEITEFSGQWIVPFIDEDLRNCLKSATKVSLWLKAHMKWFGKTMKDSKNVKFSSNGEYSIKEPSEDFIHAVLSSKLSDMKT